MGKDPIKDIASRANLRPVRLGESYAAGEVELDVIHAYNAVDAERKRRYHHDASRFLHSVGAYLRQIGGFEQMSCHSNKAGIAVAGEIYATYLRSGGGRRLIVSIEADSFWEASPREDRVVILAEWCEQEGEEARGELAAEQSTDIPKKGGKGKGRSLTAYTHTRPVVGLQCHLNPDFDSEITARCLLLVLEAERATRYWEWLPDGSLMTSTQVEEERERRRAGRKQAQAQRGQWEPISDGQAELQLGENYLAPMSSRLLLAAGSQSGVARPRDLEPPRMSRAGEEVFLQRDFEREVRRWLRALGGCLRASGYGEMRVVEPERLMLIYAEYRGATRETILRVKIGPVLNTNVPQRHDHLVIASYTVPAAAALAHEGEQCIGLGVPIQLSPAAYARQLITTLSLREGVGAEPAPSGVVTAARPARRRRARAQNAGVAESDLVPTYLF